MHFFLKRYLYFILLTWATVDLITGVFLRYKIPPFDVISFGLLIRTPLLFVVIIASFYYGKAVQQLIMLMAIILLTILCYKFLFIGGSAHYVQILIKTSGIIFFIPIFKFFREAGYLNDDKIRKIINVNVAVIAGNILLALFGLGFSKYGTTDGGIMVGSSGFFYSGNELNTAVILLFPCLLIYQKQKTKTRFLYVFLFFISLSLLSLSKTFLLGVLIIGYLYWSTYYKTNKLVILGVFCIAFIPFAFYINQLPSLSSYIDGFKYFYEKNDNFLDFITSGRYSRLMIYSKIDFFNYGSYIFWGSTNTKFFGYNFEMDYFELFFYTGLLGVFIMILFWSQVSMQYKKISNDSDKKFFLKVFFLFNVVAFIAGHSLASQMALPYLLLLLIYPQNYLKNQ